MLIVSILAAASMGAMKSQTPWKGEMGVRVTVAEMQALEATVGVERARELFEGKTIAAPRRVDVVVAPGDEHAKDESGPSL